MPAAATQRQGFSGQAANHSPRLEALVIDLDGDGFLLTGADAGVQFDIGEGSRVQTGWTKAGSTDGFLAMDLNGNGSIDNASELLSTGFLKTNREPASSGFDALLDLYRWLGEEKGGRLDANDYVFPKLLLWRDLNHDGISQPNELFPLSALGISAVTTTWTLLRVPLKIEGNAITRIGTVYVTKRGVEFPRKIASIQFAR